MSDPNTAQDTPDLATLQTAQAELTKQLDEAKSAIAESAKTAKQKDDELRRLNEAYQRDINTLAVYAQQAANAGNKPPADPEDDDAFVSKKDLRKLTEELGSSFQQHLQRTLTPIEEGRLRDQRETYKREAKRTLEHFGKYEEEIERLLDSQPIDVAAKPGAYEAAHRLVMSNHLDDLIEEKIKARTAPKDDDDGEPLPEAAQAREAPVAAGGAVGARASMRRQRVEPLNSDEKYAAEVMGNLKDATEFRQWSNPDIEVDVFGFNGRSRV